MYDAQVLEKKLDRLLAWVRAAESRLALVLSLSTAMLGAIAVSVPEIGSWSTVCKVSVALASAFLALSIIFAAFAAFPRTSGPDGSLLYFGGIRGLTADEFSTCVKARTESEYIDDLISQCHRNAEVAAKKYGWVQRAMVCLFIGAIPWLVALFILYAGE